MRYLLPAALTISLGLIAGCSEPVGEAVTEANRADVALNDVGQMFRMYTFEKHKPPTTVADFASLEQMAPLGLKALRDGDVIARSGVVIQDIEEGPATKDSADEVMAYAKEVPTSGGSVLMHNRTVKKMTADEFKAAKLAGDGDMAQGSPGKAKKS